MLTLVAVNTASDFFLAVFPMVIFWNLHLKWRIKASLIILMSLGIVYVPLPRFQTHTHANTR